MDFDDYFVVVYSSTGVPVPFDKHKNYSILYHGISMGWDRIDVMPIP